jgi:DNA-binding MarR family transcriptional regulator
VASLPAGFALGKPILSWIIMVSPAAVSQLIDRLEKLEMVARISDPEDRRVRKIVVLDQGKSFVQENFRFSQGWISELPADLTPEQVPQITEVLSMLLQSSGKKNPVNKEE